MMKPVAIFTALAGVAAQIAFRYLIDTDPATQSLLLNAREPIRILVTSAGGRVGKELVAELRKAQEHGHAAVFIRVATRNPKRGQFLLDLGADEVVRFDFADPNTFAAALDSMNVVFDSSPDPLDGGFDLVHAHDAFVKAMDPAKVNHVVRLGCVGTRLEHAFNFSSDSVVPSEVFKRNNPYTLQGVKRPETDVPHVMRAYASAELRILQSGIPLTSVRGGFFMGHFLKVAASQIKAQNRILTPFRNDRKPDISTNDLGSLCATIVLDGPNGRHRDAFYEITGAKNEDMEEVLAHFNRARGGEPCTYETIQVTPEVRSGARFGFVSYLLEHKEISERVSPDFKEIMGRDPEGYAQYLEAPGSAGETGLEDVMA